MIHIHLDELDRPGVGGQEPCDVWVPSEQVACHWVDVPAVAAKKWKAMVPWILEDRLLDKPETLEFVCGAKSTDNRVPVLVVSRTLLADWRQRVRGAGALCRQLVPDFFALPWQAGEVVVALLGDRCLLRYGPWQGLAGPAGFVLPLVDNLLKTPGLAVRLMSDTEAPSMAANLPATAELIRADELFRQPAGDWLGLPAGATVAATRRAWPLPGRIAAGLGVLLPLLLVAGEGLESQRINRQAAHLEAALGSGYRQYTGMTYDFPQADFQAVVSRQLENRSGTAGASGLKLVAELDHLLDQCPGCTVQSLDVAGDRLSATLGGEAVAARLQPALANSPDGRVGLQARGEQWLLTLEEARR